MYIPLNETFEAHKQYESMAANVDRPTSEIIDGFKQMEAEEQQLLDRLRREQSQTSNNANFQRLLAEASKMRLSQDKEIGLEEQKREQLHYLATAKRRLNQARRMLDVTTSCGAKPNTESILTDLEHESQKSVNHLESNVMQQRHKMELMLLQAEKEADSDKTEDDIEYAVEVAAQLEEILSRKQDELDKLGNHVGNSSKLAVHKQVSFQTRTSARNKAENLR